MITTYVISRQLIKIGRCIYSQARSQSQKRQTNCRARAISCSVSRTCSYSIYAYLRRGRELAKFDHFVSVDVAYHAAFAVPVDRMSTRFTGIKLGPPIEVFAVAKAFVDDPHPKKANLTIGGTCVQFSSPHQFPLCDILYSSA